MFNCHMHLLTANSAFTLGLVKRLTSPFSTKIGYMRDKILGRDLVQPG